MEDVTRPRVKFSLRHQGTLDIDDEWRDLSGALYRMMEKGYAPLLPDGNVAGNGAVRYRDGIIVSRSGRPQSPPAREDFVYVSRFDMVAWEASYFSSGAIPTSDTPLHWYALKGMNGPQAALHGHRIFEDPSIPASQKETMFSTPEDVSELAFLIQCYPYPKYKFFTRRGHGFFVLGESVSDAVDVLEQIEKVNV